MELLYSFYGDDFTGSTDVLERLALGGVPAALFLQVPTAADLRLFPGLRALGIAGDSRSQAPAWMEATLPQVFRGLRELGAPVVHYKVCSTFDSSPEHGSIGRAMEIGRRVMDPAFVPVVVGAPHLRRYVLEGQLFASDPHGVVQRIDRHPMSRHPVTPMREASLRRHLEAQTTMPVREVRNATGAAMANEVERLLRDGEQPGVVFDTVTGGDLEQIGALLWGYAERGQMFAVGSSGLTSALMAAWTRAGRVSADASGAHRGGMRQASELDSQMGPLLVMSGSCSAMTERQIRWALRNGFAGIAVEPGALLKEQEGERARRAVVRDVVAALESGRSPVVYTAMGQATTALTGDALGVALGGVLREVLLEADVHRVLLCGGDTSSQAVQQLGVRALTFAGALQTGVPLCRAHGTGRVDGLELALKGGQMGTEDFFAVVRDSEIV